MRQFWLDSFASSEVDIRAHRTRFVPPGALLGPNTIGVTPDGAASGCGSPSSWSDSATLQACQVNGYVTLGNKRYAPHACAAQWLEAVRNGSNTTVAPLCYPGSSFLYIQRSGCRQFSRDVRLSAYTSGGPGSEKCSKRIFDRYAQADDLWSAVASNEHDPCGWPFLQCTEDCSLPSDPTRKGWYVAGDGTVRNGSNAACSMDMHDPRSANRVTAM